MTNKEYIDLINKEIDGLITKKESVRLMAYLEKSQEAKETHKALHQTSDMLKNIKDVDPPANMKKRILNAVDFSKHNTNRNKFPIIDSLSRFLHRFDTKFAFAFAFGVFVTVIIYLLFISSLSEKSQLDLTDLYGTIGLDQLAEFQNVEQLPVKLPGIIGGIIYKSHKETVGFEIILETGDPVEFTMEFDEALFQFDGLRLLDQSKLIFDYKKGYIRTSFSENCRYIILFNRPVVKSGQFRLKLSRKGKEDYQRTVSILSQ